jgi:hypothetical protein
MSQSLQFGNAIKLQATTLMDLLPAALLQRFESLGDNCEFGFVQRANGYEDGGLLRWSISPLDSLALCFEADFRDLYRFENLAPSAPDMVRDSATGLMFHTRMHSIDGHFVLAEEARRQIYAQESQKIDHLLNKFRQKIQRPDTICVYKRNSGVTDSDAMRLQCALSRIGSCKLLIVRATEDRARWSTVEPCGAGLFVGLIDEFAPYFAADHLSIRIWNRLLQNASRIIDAQG